MPINLKCNGCGKTFLFKDDMAGRKIRCPDCHFVHVVPELGDEPTISQWKGDSLSQWEGDSDKGPLHSAFNRDRFLLRQKLITLSEKYVVWDDEQRPILFIERPAHVLRNMLAALVTIVAFIVSFIVAIIVGFALAERVRPSSIGYVIMAVLILLSVILTIVLGIVLSPKRHISFYADETKGELLLQVLQDKKFQPIVATYTVLTPDGQILGRMSKNYLYNFFRKKWDVFDARSSKVLIAREDSLLLSLLRRLLGPMLGFLRANFILAVPGPGNAETTRGEFNRNFTIFDRYVLDLSRDRPRTIDRRLAIALGVLLDTGEHR
jgi:hypothetical protein